MDIAYLMTLIQTWGYLGVFFAGFLSTFSLFLPSPTFVVVFLLGSTLNPIVLGIVGGLGASIGEMIGYFIGLGAGKGARRSEKIEKQLLRVEKWFNKYQPDAIIFLFAAMPVLPFDVVGLLAGTIKYDTKRFFIVTTAGKIVKYLVIAFAGFYGMDFILGSL